MTRELQQGGNTPLPDVPEILIGIGWEPDKPGGQDADPSAFERAQYMRAISSYDYIFKG